MASKRKREPSCSVIGDPDDAAADARKPSRAGTGKPGAGNPPPAKRARTGDFPAGSTATPSPPQVKSVSATAWSPEVLMKVGSAEYLPFAADGVLGLNRTTLLTALKADSVFGNQLEGTDHISVCPAVVKDMALGTTVPLLGGMTVRDAATRAGAVATAAQLRIIVTWPLHSASTLAASLDGNLVKLPDSDDFSRLAKAIAAAPSKDVEALRAERCIVLASAGDSADVQWPGMGSSVLLVRSFYHDLYSAVLGRAITTDDDSGSILLGTSGSGKSAFALYVLYRASREGRTVIYTSRDGGCAVFKRGKAYGIRYEVGNLADLNDETAVYISDAVPPVGSKGAYSLVVASPKNDNWSFFVESPGVDVLTLPMFSAAELEELRALAFAGSPESSGGEVAARMAKWGCNPRNVLTTAATSVWQGTLEAIASGVRLEGLHTALCTSASARRMCSAELVHNLVNIVPAGIVDDSIQPTTRAWYTAHHGELVTGYVEDKLLESLGRKDVDDVERFLRKTSKFASVGSLRDKLLARFAKELTRRAAPVL